MSRDPDKLAHANSKSFLERCSVSPSEILDQPLIRNIRTVDDRALNPPIRCKQLEVDVSVCVDNAPLLITLSLNSWHPDMS